jgi:LysM repeat protein
MNVIKELAAGLLFSFFSITIVFGSASLSLAEGSLLSTPLPTATLTPGLVMQTSAFIPPTPSPQVQSTQVPTPTFTSQPTATSCPPPPGWEQYIVQSGDSLQNLAEQRQMTIEEIYVGNCLFSQELIPGTYLYVLPFTPVPEAPTSTSTPIPCGPPTGWFSYTVRDNDTLYLLHVYFGVSIYELQMANCLGNSTLIRTGDILYVPSYPVFLPTSSATPLPTATATVEIPTETPAPTQTEVVIPSEVVATLETPVITEIVPTP